ncbi:Hypothetical predicted protein [Podarcis lilfordi]|uniref:Uncharacterized protein n=1 Tax=Podarcis lilfordi TaxID=74358 RepID=A0AA35NSD7_9SAUR|nr:Hypothetical predicted protein [Podarcis lilfordi]
MTGWLNQTEMKETVWAGAERPGMIMKQVLLSCVGNRDEAGVCVFEGGGNKKEREAAAGETGREGEPSGLGKRSPEEGKRVEISNECWRNLMH